MLIANVLVAILLAGLRLVWLRDAYLEAWLVHEAAELVAQVRQSELEAAPLLRERAIALGMKVEPEPESVKARNAADARANRIAAEYHAALKRKYERAEARP